MGAGGTVEVCVAACVGVSVGARVMVAVGVSSGVGVEARVRVTDGLGVFVAVGVTVGEGAMIDIRGQVQLSVILITTNTVIRAASLSLVGCAILFFTVASSLCPVRT